MVITMRATKITDTGNGLCVAVAVGAAPDAAPPVVDDETMTAQTLR